MTQQYALAVGSNNTAGLVTLSTLAPPIIVRGRGRYRVGEQVTLLDGRVAGFGRPSIAWLVGVLLPSQYAYLSTTFCAGGWWGRVTARTRLNGNAYVVGNATLVLPFTADLDQRVGRYENVTLLLSDWEVI